MRRLCSDIVSRVPELHHIDLNRVAVSFAQTRKRVTHGLQASLTPLRFAGGRATETQRGREIAVQRLFDRSGREMLYILTFYLPRYLDLSFREKLETAVHELWHIGPRFDGDLRRHAGRCYAHSHSQAGYDSHVARLVDRWLASDPPDECYAFLRYRFDELQRRCGAVYGTRIPRPKLIPASERKD
jgi:predicted metallopeptidase